MPLDLLRFKRIQGIFSCDPPTAWRRDAYPWTLVGKETYLPLVTPIALL